MKFGYGLAAIAALMMVVSPHTAAAFSQDSIDRDGYVSKDGYTAAFILSTWVGGFKDDIYIPIVGERDVPYGTRGKTFGYQIESGYPDTVSEEGATQVLALSRAPIVDGMYKIAAGTFSLVKFVGIMQVTEQESNIYRLRVHELPFYIGDDRASRYYSDGELQYLVTNYEALNYEQDPQ